MDSRVCAHCCSRTRSELHLVRHIGRDITKAYRAWNLAGAGRCCVPPSGAIWSRSKRLEPAAMKPLKHSLASCCNGTALSPGESPTKSHCGFRGTNCSVFSGGSRRAERFVEGILWLV